MPIPKIPPGWGGEVPYVHFKYTGTPKRTKWNAWVAGPAVWLIGHNKPPSKPCLDKMTMGCLLCPRCAKGHAPRKMAYQPLYRMVDGKPVVVILYEEEELYTKQLITHQGVTIGRENDDSDTVYIRPLLGDYPKYQTTLFERTLSVDCTDSLLTMWAIPEWTAWCKGSYGGVQPTPQKMPAEILKSDGKPFSEQYVSAARRWADVPAVEPTSGDNAVQAAVDRAALIAAQAGHKNGKPKPKG